MFQTIFCLQIFLIEPIRKKTFTRLIIEKEKRNVMEHHSKTRKSAYKGGL